MKPNVHPGRRSASDFQALETALQAAEERLKGVSNLEFMLKERTRRVAELTALVDTLEKRSASAERAHTNMLCTMSDRCKKLEAALADELKLSHEYAVRLAPEGKASCEHRGSSGEGEPY